MTTAKPNRTQPPLGELLLVAAIVVIPRLWFLAFTHITYEDSLISLRYAHNLAAGYGLVYNAGERVFGATTPLYVLLLAALSVFSHGGPLFWAKLLCVLADGLTGAIWYQLLRRETGTRLGALAFLAAFSFSPFIVEISTSGMETPLVLLCLTLAYEAETRQRGRVLGLWLGLLLLLRLDAAIFAAILLAARAQRERRLPWRDVAVMTAVTAPWFLFSLLYYGSLIPNSIPAKLNAYNMHMHSMARQLSFTLSHFTPYRNGVRESLFAALFLPLALIGGAAALRQHRAMRPVLLFFLAQWAFLVLPRTLIFRWYLPPLLLPYYVLGGLGAATLLKWHASAVARPALHRTFALTLVAGLALHTCHWLTAAAWRVWALQSYEETVRKPIGLWLARNTPADALISTEPIGYIGYYSGRRILDEVGLVSPGVIPMNRRGAGWFTAVVKTFRPDYIVERPHFLMANKTLNTGVPMFASAAERDWFWTQYRAVRGFPCAGSRAYERAYSFVILKRREATDDTRQLKVSRADGAQHPPIRVKATGRS
jgi:hypothetical protein